MRWFRRGRRVGVRPGGPRDFFCVVCRDFHLEPAVALGDRCRNRSV